MSDNWLFKDDEPVSPEMQAIIDRTNDEIRAAYNTPERKFRVSLIRSFASNVVGNAMSMLPRL